MITSAVLIAACSNSNVPQAIESIDKIVFDISNTDGTSVQIYSIDPNGDNLTKVTAGKIDTYPSLSPDGNKIVYQSFQNSSIDIYIINIDGTGKKLLTNHQGDNGQPSWSPDEKKIIFYSSRAAKSLNARYIYIMDADGSNQVRLISNSSQSISPTWSPDGGKIAFASDNGSTQREEASICTMNVDGSNQTILKNVKGKISWLAWSS
jgi:Tol biopolymer transport system component